MRYYKLVLNIYQVFHDELTLPICRKLLPQYLWKLVYGIYKQWRTYRKYYDKLPLLVIPKVNNFIILIDFMQDVLYLNWIVSYWLPKDTFFYYINWPEFEKRIFEFFSPKENIGCSIWNSNHPPQK